MIKRLDEAINIRICKSSFCNNMIEDYMGLWDKGYTIGTSAYYLAMGFFTVVSPKRVGKGWIHINQAINLCMQRTFFSSSFPVDIKTIFLIKTENSREYKEKSTYLTELFCIAFELYLIIW